MILRNKKAFLNIIFAILIVSLIFFIILFFDNNNYFYEQKLISNPVKLTSQDIEKVSHQSLFTESLKNKNIDLSSNNFSIITFSEKAKYTLSLSVLPQGKGEVSGGEIYEAGAQVKIVATPLYGFEFEKWSDDSGLVVSDSCVYEFEMPAYNYNLTAYFKKKIPCSNDFISEWDTTKIRNAGEPNNQITLPLVNDGIYDFRVDWGDGTTNIVTSYDDINKTHIYAQPGVYTLAITGTINGFSFKDYFSESLKILNISQWGCLNLGNSGFYFFYTQNLDITTTDILDLNNTRYFRFKQHHRFVLYVL